jgi:hypothetical protein
MREVTLWTVATRAARALGPDGGQEDCPVADGSLRGVVSERAAVCAVAVDVGCLAVSSLVG